MQQFQSTYFYIATQSAPKFDWNITLTDPLDIIKPTTEQGIYKMVTEYILDDKHYSVSLYKKDCLNKPTPMNAISLVLEDIDNNINANNENKVQLMFSYNQTSVQRSDLWTANKTGGYSEFCIKVRNFLEEDGNPLARQIHFLEVKYRIEVDSLTDFNETITVDRIDATDGGVEEINYEEEITVFQCKDDYTEITSPVPLTQGDFLQICVTTKGDSKFGVHSIKELDVSQQDNTSSTPSLFPYVDAFVDSPLAESDCKAKNTSAAICKTKMQLLSAYFDSTEPDALFANGTVKLDYVGRRLSVDVPVSIRYDGDGAVTEEAAASAGRVLAEGDEGPSFGIEVGLSGDDGSASDASLSLLSIGGLFSAGMAFLIAGMV